MVENRESRKAWQTVKEVIRRKCTAKAKLKTPSEQERLQLWKQHFENLLGTSPKVTHEPITKIISKQLDIKLGKFMQEELDCVRRKIKIEQQQALIKYSQKYRRPGNLTIYCSNTVLPYIIKTQ